MDEKIGQVFSDASDKAAKVNKEYWQAIDEGDLERAAELQEQRAKQLAEAGKLGAKTAVDTPYGTSISGPPPTSFNVWDALGEVAGFAIEKGGDVINWFSSLFRPGKVEASPYSNSTYSSGNGHGGGGGGGGAGNGGSSWGGPTCQRQIGGH